MDPYWLVRRKSPVHHTIIEISTKNCTLKIGQGFSSVIANINCQEETKLPESLWQHIHAAGVRIIGINLADSSWEAVEQTDFIPNLFDFLDQIHAAGLAAMTSIIDFSQLEFLYPHVDLLQVPSRHMQNYSLMEALGRIDKPVVLERGYAASVEEWLMAAEYVMVGGNQQVILCESGIRTFEKLTRRTLDVSAIALAKYISHLPVIAYPGQATGRSDVIVPVCMASIAAGADALIADLAISDKQAGSGLYKPLSWPELARFVQIISSQAGFNGMYPQ